MQREHSRNNLFMIVTRLKAILETIPSTAGFIKDNCLLVLKMFTKIEQQFQVIKKNEVDNDEI